MPAPQPTEDTPRLRRIICVLLFVLCAIPNAILNDGAADDRFNPSLEGYLATEKSYLDWYRHEQIRVQMVNAAIAGTLPPEKLSPQDRPLAIYAHFWLFSAGDGTTMDGAATLARNAKSPSASATALRESGSRNCPGKMPTACKMEAPFTALNSVEALNELRAHPPVPPKPPADLADFAWQRPEGEPVPWSFRAAGLVLTWALVSILRTIIGFFMGQPVFRPITMSDKLFDLLAYPLHFIGYRLGELWDALRAFVAWMRPGPLGRELRKLKAERHRLEGLKEAALSIDDKATARQIDKNIAALDELARERVRLDVATAFEEAKTAIELETERTDAQQEALKGPLPLTTSRPRHAGLLLCGRAHDKRQRLFRRLAPPDPRILPEPGQLPLREAARGRLDRRDGVFERPLPFRDLAQLSVTDGVPRRKIHRKPIRHPRPHLVHPSGAQHRIDIGFDAGVKLLARPVDANLDRLHERRAECRRGGIPERRDLQRPQHAPRIFQVDALGRG